MLSGRIRIDARRMPGLAAEGGSFSLLARGLVDLLRSAYISPPCGTPAYTRKKALVSDPFDQSCARMRRQGFSPRGLYMPATRPLLPHPPHSAWVSMSSIGHSAQQPSRADEHARTKRQRQRGARAAASCDAGWRLPDPRTPLHYFLRRCHHPAPRKAAFGPPSWYSRERKGRARRVVRQFAAFSVPIGV